MKKKSFIISGGGTGGHIYPAIAIANALKEKYPEAQFMFVGASDRMEMQKVPKAGYPIKGLWISGLQRGQIVKNLLIPFKLLSSFWNSYKIIKKQKPNIAIGTGGYASAALLKVAGWLKVPSLVQEQNSFPGITNKILAKDASKICVAYENLERFFPKEKIVLTGNPVRQDIVNSKVTSAEAKLYYNLNEDKKTLLIVGGSLGAKAINELIAEKLPLFKELGLQLLWQCGQLYFDRFKHLQSETVQINAFLDRMDLAYAAANVIISRAGAGSVSELAIVGKPVLFIPSPNVAEDHQTKNAQAIVAKNAAKMVKQSNLEEKFDAEIKDLVTNVSLQNQLSENIKKLAKPNATNSIITQIEKIIEA